MLTAWFTSRTVLHMVQKVIVAVLNKRILKYLDLRRRIFGTHVCLMMKMHQNFRMMRD